jgi:nucleoid-associated protein YgaU
VVLVIGILFIFLVKDNKNQQDTSSTDTTKTEENSDTSSAYTIKPGDDLWSISEDVYNDGYKWVEIAKINNLENPGVIHVGNKLTLPKITAVPKVTPQPTDKPQTMITQNNSITGTTYKIKEGDNLWDICVRAYGDGYKWVKIARVNNLENPDLIHPDNTLQLPR